MSGMRNHLCWMCHATTSHKTLHEPSIVNTRDATAFSDDELQYLVAAALQCQVCGGISVGIANIPRHVSPGQQCRAWIDSAANLPDDAFTWRPRAGDTKRYHDVPPHIADAATEAFECHGVGHHRAAILLARSVIEATAKDKGISKGNLKTKIEEMEEQALIRPLIKNVADGIRDYGNEMAHGDFGTPVGGAESDMVIQLMGVILEEVYEISEKLARIRDAVGARQQDGGQ